LFLSAQIFKILRKQKQIYHTELALGIENDIASAWVVDFDLFLLDT
jgi:hypothetical protein